VVYFRIKDVYNIVDMYVRCIASVGLLSLVCAGGPSLARAGSVSYLVTVDTTGGNGLPGFLDAKLASAAPPVSASVTAMISNYSSDATAGPVTIAVGDHSGSFSSTPLVLGNDSAGSAIPNQSELQQMGIAATFLSFTLTLSGSEVNGGGGVPFTGTVFTFLLEETSGIGLNQGPLAGEAFDVYLNPDGSLTVTPNDPYQADGPVSGYAPAIGAYPQITISAVPEPSSKVLLGVGLGVIAACGRWRRRPAHRAA
jgi:PEP-CTERM motif